MARPIEFDRESVLEEAVNTFWQYGYCATSISDLVDATDLKPGSIYAAFESKEGLFFAAIDFYGQRSIDKVTHCLSQAKSPLDGIRNYFGQLIEESRRDTSHRGCFLVNTVLEVAPHNENVQKRVSHYLDAVERCFLQALRAAKKQGELAAGRDPKSLAKFLMVTIWGIRVLQRTAPDEKTLKAIVKQYLLLLEA